MNAAEAIHAYLELVSCLQWTEANLERCARDTCEEAGWKMRDFCLMLRLAIQGRHSGPPLFKMMDVFWKRDRCMKLLTRAEIFYRGGED